MNNEKQYSRKEAKKRVMELHIRRASTPDKAPIVMSPIFVMASNDLVFDTLEQAKQYCQNWSIYLTNKMQRSVSCKARYRHPHSEDMFRTVSHRHKHNEVIQN